MKRWPWFLLQIVLFIIGTVAVYFYRPDGEGQWIIAPIAGFCFAYWVTWALSKLIDVPPKAARFLQAIRAFWR